MCKYDQIMECILLSFHFCCPDYILSKKLSRCDTYFICIFEFLDHIDFRKVVLNIFKVNMDYSVHSAHFNMYFLRENVEKMKKMWHNI